MPPGTSRYREDIRRSPTTLGWEAGCQTTASSDVDGHHEVRVACDLTTDVANEPAEPGAQNAQLSAVAIELFGVGITACHHGGALGNAQVRLPQPHAVLSGQSGQPLDRGV